ncbi:MAG: hypothetical protein P8Y66_00460 [Nitrospirota bacterium]|jgi:hypothetical protein
MHPGNNNKQKSAAETSAWLRESKQKHRALFSEMDVLMRALDRYFLVENLPFSRESLGSRDFSRELACARDVIRHVLTILESIIPESNRNAFWFQKYAETRLVNGQHRDLVRTGMYEQDAPEKSLYVLFDGFINFKGIITDMLKAGAIEYVSFRNVGQLIGKELRHNVYFNPFRKDVDPELDAVSNREIADIVRNIGDRNTKKAVSTVLLNFFRFLRYIRHMDHSSQSMRAIHCSLAIFALLKAEMEQLRLYIERKVRTLPRGELATLLESLGYQMSMEGKRVFHQELLDILDKENTAQMRARVENSRGILKNLTEQSIIQLAKHWNPDLRGEEIFDVFITKTALSVKLREDIYILNRLLKEAPRRAGKEGELGALLGSLMNYLDYFESYTSKLLRYDDYEEFTGLAGSLRSAWHNGESTQKVLESCHKFGVYLDTTLRYINNRGDLKDRPLDEEKVEEVVQMYLSIKR